ncbi:MAG: DUF6884 domain-containing protein [Bacteroidota bacterium]
MSRILLMCSANKKLAQPAPAKLLYRSALFQQGWAYALSFEAEAYYILSTRYGLVPAEREIAPYPETMSALTEVQLDEWAELIISDLAQLHALAQTEVILLGMRRFVNPIAERLPYSQTPLVGMSMPELMGFLRRKAWETK